MSPVRSFLLCLLLAPVAFAQGVRMPAEFLPLEVGKRWNYDLMNEAGQKVGQTAFIVEDYTIVQGTSFYVLSNFPFSKESEDIRLIRYDRSERTFIRKLGNDEGPLFFGDGATTEVLASDSAGTATKFRLRSDGSDLIFERGVGVIEARIQRPNGIVVAKLAAAPAVTSSAPAPAGASNRTTAGGPASTPTVVVPRGAPMVVIPPAEPPVTRREPVVATLSSSNPQMNLGVSRSTDGFEIVLVVTNTSEKLLPFRFGSSQTFDFAISDESGKEIWRWSKGRFFTQMTRSDSIRSKGKWQFQEVWNARDNDGVPVGPGRYIVSAIINSLPPVSASPVLLELR